jgi:hypothetical protein
MSIVILVFASPFAMIALLISLINVRFITRHLLSVCICVPFIVFILVFIVFGTRIGAKIVEVDSFRSFIQTDGARFGKAAFVYSFFCSIAYFCSMTLFIKNNTMKSSPILPPLDEIKY